jgi:FdhD protein
MVAVEVPVNIVYGLVPYAVMMMTPLDLEDFVVGFSITEGIIASPDDVRAIAAEEEPNGVRLMVDLAPDRLHAMLARQRAMRGRTSCGVCGIENLADLPRTARRPAEGTLIGTGAIRRALGELEGHQVLNAETRSMHAAAWADASGAIVCTREDVGRHNALDKLIGALLMRRVDPGAGFIVLTSRCSYEMVEKAAAFGAAVVVAISAPTSLAITRAVEHGTTLVAIARRDGISVFSNPGRIAIEEGVEP